MNSVISVNSQLIDRSCPPKSHEFYADSAKTLRHYFYVLDTRGNLFLEEVSKRNIATCMKDLNFLDFITKNMQLNTTNFYADIPLISKCGKEVNFISPSDRKSLLTFKDLNNNNTLIYGGRLTQEFLPPSLAYSPDTGRLYHKIINHKFLSSDTYGLLHPTICELLSANIIMSSDSTYKFQWNNVEHNLNLI